MRWLRKHGWALGGFVLLALLLTYPISIRLGHAVPDLGEPLLNSWIWAWEVHSLSNPGSTRFFDTNIFFPHLNTLAYSELLLPQLVVAGPALLLWGNPILAHNLVLLASLIATAFTSYLLAHYLTGSRPAGVIAGLIFAFCPFMFGHLSHVQVLFAAGIPLTLLFMHRWLEEGRTRHAVLMGVTYALQALGNTYFAVYLTFFGGTYLVIELLRRRLWRRERVGWQLLAAGLIAIALVAPFYSHYLQLKNEMAFSRTLPAPTPTAAYFAVPESNRLYGRLLGPLGMPEGRLFPGITTSILALVGFAGAMRRYWRGGSSDHRPPIFALLVLLVAAGWLSLGTGTYRVLFEWIPGFDSLRAVSRIFVMVMLALGLLAAYGSELLQARLRGKWGALVTWSICGLIIIEYLSIPLAVQAAPKRAEFPPVYDWLAQQDEQTTFVAYPLRERAQKLQLHFSTLHWRRMLHGFSGHIPPLFEEIVSHGRRFPSLQAVDDFRALGIDLLLIDIRTAAPARRPRLLRRLRRMGHLTEVGQFDDITVFRIHPAGPVASDTSEKPKSDAASADLTAERLTVRSSSNTGSAPYLNDGDRKTVWEAPMRGGQWIEIDLGQVRTIRGVELDLGGHARSYPRGYRIEVSPDGTDWTIAGKDSSFRPPITDFVVPGNMVARLEISPMQGRWIRIFQTSSSSRYAWRVAELGVLIGS